MKELTAYLIEDEPKALESLLDMIEQHCPNLKVLGTASSIKNCWSDLTEQQPDLVFLDMHLPDGMGYDIIDEPETKGIDFVFTTGDESFALKAFELGAVDYLLKPIGLKRLRNAVQKVMEKRQARKPDTSPKEERIALPVLDGLEFVKPENIMYCTASGPYVEVYLCDGDKKLISKNLGKFEQALTSSQFLRIHDSHLINLNKVNKYIKGRGGQVVMDNGSVLGVAQRRKDAFLRHFGNIS